MFGIPAEEILDISSSWAKEHWYLAPFSFLAFGIAKMTCNRITAYCRAANLAEKLAAEQERNRPRTPAEKLTQFFLDAVNLGAAHWRFSGDDTGTMLCADPKFRDIQITIKDYSPNFFFRRNNVKNELVNASRLCDLSKQLKAKLDEQKKESKIQKIVDEIEKANPDKDELNQLVDKIIEDASGRNQAKLYLEKLLEIRTALLANNPELRKHESDSILELREQIQALEANSRIVKDELDALRAWNVKVHSWSEGIKADFRTVKEELDVLRSRFVVVRSAKQTGNSDIRDSLGQLLGDKG